MRWLILLIIPLFVWVGCKGDDPIDDPRGPVDTEEIALEYPDYFPAPFVPTNNRPTATKVKLGKKLFFDPILSQDSTISCASCHFQANAFSDPRPFSPGVGGVTGSEASLRRNAPPLFNLAWHTSMFWDGSIEDGAGTEDQMENQVRVPIEAPHEMASDFKDALDRLAADQEYVELFWQAFGDTITELRVMQAIATFERTLISAGSKYDQFIASGFTDSTLFTSSEWRGYKLYFAETGARHAECFHCHGGFNFDDPAGLFRMNGIFDDYEDFGRFNVTGNEFDFAKFKVPSLRNIEYTAPYMHDGSVETLEEVLDMYVLASEETGVRNRDILISNIVLTEQDKVDIIAFLKTLSDPGFLSNPAFQPE